MRCSIEHCSNARARDGQRNDAKEDEQKADAARVILDHAELPHERRRDERTDDGIDDRIAFVTTQVDQRSRIGAARRTDQKEARRHHGEGEHMDGDDDGFAHEIIVCGERQRSADSETKQVGDQEDRADDVRSESNAWPRGLGGHMSVHSSLDGVPRQRRLVNRLHQMNSRARATSRCCLNSASSERSASGSPVF